MSKYLPLGTTFKINNQLVGGLISIGMPDRQRGAAETTDGSSTGDRTYIAGLRQGGSVKLTFRHDPDDIGQQYLETNYMLATTAATVTCVITLPNLATALTGSRSYTFDGFVEEPPKGDLGLTDDQAAQMTASIKICTAVTVA